MRWHADMAHLRDLVQQEGWDTYQAYAHKVITENIETLITGDQQGSATAWRQGYIMGLRRALQLPHEVIKNTQHARGN